MAADVVVNIDYDGLVYANHPPQSLICPVCRSVLLNPLQTRCKHIFCTRCLARAFEDKLECPIDRVPLPKGLDDCEPTSRLIDQLIDDLKVICTNQGCHQIIERGLLRFHIRDECPYTIVPCADCQQPVIRLDAKICKHGRVECEHCLASTTKLDMPAHLEECPELSHECPHCKAELSASDMLEHRGTCPEEMIVCQAGDVGCEWSGCRALKDEHEEACPLSRLRPYLLKQTMRIEHLELQNHALKEQISTLQNAAKEEPIFEISSEYERDRAYLFQSLENLSASVENLTTSVHGIDSKQSHLLINESMRTKDEMAHLRASMQSLRLQWHHFVQSTRGPLSLNSQNLRSDLEAAPGKTSPTRQSNEGSRGKL